MTTLSTTATPLDRPGPAPLRLVRSELVKIRTTNVWWLFTIGAFIFTALSLWIWTATGSSQINDAAANAGETFVPPEGASALEVEALRQQFEVSHDLGRTLVSVAANVYTSGQFFGLMFALLLGAILVTNEYYHQTATTTFLSTPHRSSVIVAKLGTSMIGAAFFWLFSTVMSLVVGVIFFNAKGYATQLGAWPVQRAILFNLLAYALWGVLGVGLGVLIRNQIGAVLTGSLSYVIGTQLIQGLAFLLTTLLDSNWPMKAIIAWPATASSVMISPEKLYPEAPDWWVGGLVLLGYGVLFGVIGTLIMRKRDVS
jgi:ABC-type transport system involved in multi-copper enzyme maturation permease subunit